MRKHIKLDPSKKYSQSEVNRIFSHISPRTLLMIANDGVVECIEEKWDRRGLHRTYRLEHLYQIAVATHLSQLGLSYSMIKRLVMDHLMKDKDSKGNPNILNYMDKVFGIKLTEAKVVDGKTAGFQTFTIYTVDIEDRENIATLADSLYKAASLDHLLKYPSIYADWLDGFFTVNPKTNKLQSFRELANSGVSLPITSMIIVNLAQLAAQVEDALTSGSSALKRMSN